MGQLKGRPKPEQGTMARVQWFGIHWFGVRLCLAGGGLASLLWVTGCAPSEKTVPVSSDKGSVVQQGSATDQLQTASRKNTPLSETETAQKRETVSPKETTANEPESELFQEQAEPDPVFRPSDTRVVPPEKLLKQLGIHTVESTRIKIYSDLPVEKLAALPRLVDALYDALLAYFGPLPPNREQTEFQLTGYLMSDVELFRESGLLPQKFAQLKHGRHRGAEFWMVVPAADYYLQHLMLHEATHCYMMFMPRVSAPVWYLEGMAELFATHQVDTAGRVKFRVFPDVPENFEGFGRIELIEQDIEQNGLKSIPELELTESGGYTSNVSYAWAWAFCAFLDHHSQYGARFRFRAREFLLETPWEESYQPEFKPRFVQLNQEWLSFVSELDYGMKPGKLEINFTPGKKLIGETESEIGADRGWQNTGILLTAGETYQVLAQGEFVLGETTRPWTSTADGISFRYYHGLPLGRLTGAICPSRVTTLEQEQCFVRSLNLGGRATFKVPYTGTLHLRLNEGANHLDDNRGSVKVLVKHQVTETQGARKLPPPVSDEATAREATDGEANSGR